ncbi:hypothetical protein FACS189468_7310 [Spirochaetia bacterium]|nr:hypothetical protein FACS189468_7310 [Spirochaetia bacterium]
MKTKDEDEKTIRSTVPFPVDLWEKVKNGAKRHRRSANDELIVSLEEYFTFSNMMSGISEKLLAKIEGFAFEETNGDLSNMMAILVREAVEEREERFIASKLDENIEVAK